MQVGRTRGLLFTLLTGLIIVVGTYIAIQYAKGGFRLTDQGIVSGAGLLSATSVPSGAEVYINDRLVTATDDTLYLDPAEYRVSIRKDGFSSWEKTLTIEAELVTQTNALLFPSAPRLTPLTFTGVELTIPSPDGQKLLFYTASSSAQRKNGLYVLDLNQNTLSFQQGPKQLISDVDTDTTDLAQASYIWSPDSSQVMMLSPNRQVLIDIDSTTDLATQPDISFQRQQILSQWEEEMFLRERQFLEKFPPELTQFVIDSAINVYFSPDKKKLLYTATNSGQLADELGPSLPAASTQPQQRSLEPGGIYVYDLDEDRNFRVGTDDVLTADLHKILLTQESAFDVPLLQTATSSAYRTLQTPDFKEMALQFKVYHSSLYANTLQWFPNSTHLFAGESGSIVIREYDNTNQTQLYSGPFDNDFMYPWPDGSRLIIATTFSPQSPTNLYAVELK